MSASLDSFICSICLEVYKSPVRTECGHIFCRECILDCTDCPVCRGHVGERFSRDRKTEKDIATLRVRCTLCNQTVSDLINSTVAKILIILTPATADLPDTYLLPRCFTCTGQAGFQATCILIGYW
jgi:hypothetical protein